MFRPSISILRILQSTSLPMNLLISPGFLISTCEAGKKTGTPMSTSNPPLIRRITLPLTTSPSFLLLRIVSQPLMISALRLDNNTSPLSESVSSRRTSISAPITILSEPSNSAASTIPSLFSPTSTITSFPICDTIVPLRIAPGRRESTLVCNASSKNSLS